MDIDEQLKVIQAVKDGKWVVFEGKIHDCRQVKADHTFNFEEFVYEIRERRSHKLVYDLNSVLSLIESGGNPRIYLELILKNAKQGFYHEGEE